MRAVLGLALFLALAASASAGWAGLLAPVAPVLETAGQGGLVGTLAGVLGQAPEPPQPDLSNYNCGGTAPITNTCLQEFDAPAGATWRLFTSGGTGFTGTVVATLADAEGHAATWSCSYLLYVGGVSEPPACSGSGAALSGGLLRLAGAVTDVNSGAPSAGAWEVGVELS